MSYYRNFAGLYVRSDNKNVRAWIRGKRRPVRVTIERWNGDAWVSERPDDRRLENKRIDCVALPFLRGGWERVGRPGDKGWTD